MIKQGMNRASTGRQASYVCLINLDGEFRKPQDP